MKRILIATAALAAMTGTAYAGPNMGIDADDVGNTGAESWTVNGFATAKCGVDANSNTVTLTNDMTDDQAFVRPAVAQEIANALNATGTTAFCNGNSNSVVLSRTALRNTATDGDQGGPDSPAQSVIYDLFVDIAGANRSTPGGSGETDGTSDGAGNGPGRGVGAGQSVSFFGATPAGAAVTFRQEQPAAAVANDLNGAEAPRSSYTTTANRLFAGNYTGTVTLTISPL